MSLKACVLTASDTCAADPSQDRSGPLLADRLRAKGFAVVEQSIVADIGSDIEETLRKWCDSTGVDLILTTGGTGFTGRDVTPEATAAVIEREAPGIACALINGSLSITPMAMLSRLRAGIRKSTLIVNFPGSAKACEECFRIVDPVLEHAIHQLRDDSTKISVSHRQLNSQAMSSVRLSSVGSRPRRSQFPMISMNDAINRIMAEVKTITDIQMISITDLDRLNGRVLATGVTAQIPVPPFRASIKDGYAVMASDGSGHRKVMSKASTAGGKGVANEGLVSGYCTRISTGAPLPEGADAVVQVEDTDFVELNDTGEEVIVSIEKEPIIGQDIRPVGCDIEANDKPVVSGLTQLGAIELGLLSSIGVHSVPVLRRPVVAVLSTGDEIVNPGQPLSFGQIWDSNRTTLTSLLKQSSVDVLDLGIAVDDIHDIFRRMSRGLLAADVLITTGGVSMGERDLVKQIIETDFSAVIHFGRIDVKPGKPTTFATCLMDGSKKYIFGLPGNPISAFVTFHLFVNPVLTCLSGKAIVERTVDISSYQKTLSVRLICDPEVYPLDDRPEFARAVITYSDDIPTAALTGNQRSSRLMSAKEANALVLLPARSQTVKSISSGQSVRAFLL